jgi:hypothetical protein
MTIRIFSKQAFRFKNPNKSILDPNTAEAGFVPGMSVNEQKYDEIYFDTVPNEVQNAPDWIKAVTPDRCNINTFETAVRAGLLTEMPQIPQVTSGKPSIADEAAQAEARARLETDVSARQVVAATVAAQQATEAKQLDAPETVIKTRKKA